MSGKRVSRSLPVSFDVYSDAHEGRTCTACKLCGESNSSYTHPAKWKNKELVTYLRRIEPNMIISQDICICRKCRKSLRAGLSNPCQFQPRWQKSNSVQECQIQGCTENAFRSTRLASHEDIERLLKLSLKAAPCVSDSTISNLCALHKEINPLNYQKKCATCG